MFIEKFYGYDIWESDGHGKNVKGNKKTSSIQVRLPQGSSGYLLKYSASFKVGDEIARVKAFNKCKQYITDQYFKTT